MIYDRVLLGLCLVMGSTALKAQEENFFNRQFPGFQLLFASPSVEIENFYQSSEGFVVMFNSLDRRTIGSSFVVFSREHLPGDTLTITCIPALRNTSFWSEDGWFFYRPEFVRDKLCSSSYKTQKVIMFQVSDNKVQNLSCKSDVKTTSSGKNQRSDTYRFKEYTLVKSASKNEIEMSLNGTFSLKRSRKQLDEKSFSPEIVFKHYIRDSVAIIFDTNRKLIYRFINGFLRQTISVENLSAAPYELDLLYDDIKKQIYVREGKANCAEVLYRCSPTQLTELSITLANAQPDYTTTKVPLKRAMRISDNVLYSVMKLKEGDKSFDGLFYTDLSKF